MAHQGDETALRTEDRRQRLSRVAAVASAALGAGVLATVLAGPARAQVTGGKAELDVSGSSRPLTVARREPGGACARLDLDVDPRASVIRSVNQGGIQNLPAGVTPTGSSMLIQRGGCSTGLSLFVADEVPERSGVYETTAVSPLPGVDTSGEEYVTLMADGLTLVALTSDHRGLLALTCSEVGRADFGQASKGAFADFTRITVMAPQGLWAPAVSADGLALYFTVLGDPDPSVNGIYESVRPSTRVPFPRGTRMPPLVQSLAQYVNGTSADRLAIFLEDKAVFRTLVLTRATLAAPFANPRAPGPPPTAPGLRTRSLGDCTQLIGVCALLGGCSNEAVCRWGRATGKREP